MDKTITIARIDTQFGRKAKPVLINLIVTGIGEPTIELRLGERQDAGRSRMVHLNTTQAEAIREGLNDAINCVYQPDVRSLYEK